jgi:hypothetical protein
MRNINLNFRKLWVCTLLILTIAACKEEAETIVGSKPIADAGPDLTSMVGATVTLDGSASLDADGDVLTYSWEIVNMPATSAADVANANIEVTSFIPDMAGVYLVRLTVNDGNNAEVSDEAIITVEEPIAATIIVDTDITINTTWVDIFEDPTIADYRVTANIDVTADLVIEPGVVIEFESNVGLNLQGEGSLNAVGTDNENILFTGVEKTPGFWKGINIQSNKIDNIFNHSIVEYGGSSGFDGAGLLANIMLNQSGRVAIENTILRGSAGSGIYLRDGDVEIESFSNNTLTENNYPASALISKFHFFEGNNDYDGNTNDFINGMDRSLEQDVTWQSLNVPYRLTDSFIYISSELTINAGARFIAASGAGLQVYQGGSLIAIGTAEDNISFYGEEDVRGFWSGISIETNDPSNELTYVNVSNGGSDGFDGGDILGNVIVDHSGRLKMNNCTLTKSGGAGLTLRVATAAISEFSNNTITDNLAAVDCLINHFAFFDEASDYTGNDRDYVTAFSSGTIEVDQTWRKLNVPYRLNSGSESINGNLTINPGVEVVGRSNSGLAIESGASLSAVGTAADRIIFRGQEDIKGYWKGLRFRSNTNSNLLEYVNISNGGSDGFDGANRKANVEVDGGNSRCHFVECNVNDSGGYGIRIESGGIYTLTATNFSGNQQTGNAEGGGIQNDNL